MTVQTLPPPTRPARALLTCDQFHAACDAGVYEGRNVHLVDGEVLEMPAANPPHNSTLDLSAEAFRQAFGRGHWVRGQMGLELSLDIDPVPDLAVIVGTSRTVHVQPTTALLVAEVSDSTLAYDRGDKANLYAAGGIADYWVIDINGRQVIRHTDPVADPAAPHGHRYATVRTHPETDVISPLAAPTTTVRVADLLP